MLGAEIETFRGNKLVVGLVAVLALGAAWLVYIAFTSPPPPSGTDYTGRILALILLAVPVLLFFWLNSIQVTLHSDGLSYRSLFGEKEMRWDEVERFYFGAVKERVNFIPVGTYYHFKFVDAEGKKLRLGNRVEYAGKLGQKLVEHSYPALFKKVADEFNSGQEVDFGAIRVSRASGLKVKKLFGYKEIPWNQVFSYAIQDGRFCIWRMGEKRTRGTSLLEVPNAFVLQGLLNSIFKPSTAS
jgi:hypothetical protein